MEPQACSLEGPSLCPNGFSCYSHTSGFLCRPSNTTGCIITPQGSLEFVHKPLAPFGEQCQQCTVPTSPQIRQQFQSHLSHIVDDEGWHTYGNCADGFCGSGHICRLKKERLSLCVTHDQCISGMCARLPQREGQFACTFSHTTGDTAVNVWVGRAIAIAGMLLLLLSLLGLWAVHKRIRQQHAHARKLVGKAATPSSNAVSPTSPTSPAEDSFLVAVEEAQWLERKLKMTTYFGIVLGLAIIVLGVVYSLLPPSAFPYDDTH
ncbi:hypothetical protein SYNPS1DRAFT_30347 [Syncephalis pseudoplumigaleata]|uniref:Uncharacterized protein n=1 Tax=Syncephalis pseudoplumigaleata TaxID=1712513 RepID=A0A4P9YX44_9FUNG|nr:hypothetical protein SYNPS1DRAFT_30347 [Syncephalis pseudoplumigaleata]|eukprot:RKP23891.1 hypothetical protein SYNPS1DRAFT_30347 [Syncephalis pseudoplumigaleata]